MTNQEFLESITLDGEEWRDVVGYEGRYLVSSHGRVVGTPINRKTPKIILQRSNECYRYLSVVLWGNDKKYHSHFVHRLVADAFIPNPNNKLYVDHIDTDASNNKASNLAWATQHENLSNPLTRSRRVGSKHNITPPNRRKIVQLKNGCVVKVYEYISAASKDGFSESCIIRCCQGLLKHYKQFQWMYLEDYEASNQ